MKITGTSGTRALTVIAKASPPGMTRSTSNRSIFCSPPILPRAAVVSDHAEPCPGEMVIDHPTDGRIIFDQKDFRPEGLSSSSSPSENPGSDPWPQGWDNCIVARAANSRPGETSILDWAFDWAGRTAAIAYGHRKWFNAVANQECVAQVAAAPTRTGWAQGGLKRCRNLGRCSAANRRLTLAFATRPAVGRRSHIREIGGD